jgi:hypothetical protein
LIHGGSPIDRFKSLETGDTLPDDDSCGLLTLDAMRALIPPHRVDVD